MSISVNDKDELYVISFRMEKDTVIQVGKREHCFKAGYYVYIGSAKKNIQKRVERHYKMDKRKHWHLDYLRPHMEWISVHTFPGTIGECGLKEVMERMLAGKSEVKGIGSSDCGCDTHFLHVGKTLSRQDALHLRKQIMGENEGMHLFTNS